MRKTNVHAFTLAEVLITLGIIGVVAALTIPTLINNYQKTQYATQLKKAYTELNQAFAQLAVDKGCTGDMACLGLFSSASSTTDWTKVLTELQPYIKYSQICGGTDANYECFAHYYKDLKGTNNDPATGSKAITISGYSILVNDWLSGNCVSTYSVPNKGGVCARIGIDINGPKPPNIRGRDFFAFLLTSSGALYPYGGQEVPTSLGMYPWDNTSLSTSCLPNQTSYGWGCAGRIMEDGWQMNY